MGSVGVKAGLLLLLPGELVKERLRCVVLKRQRGLVDGLGGGLLAGLFALQVALECIEEETVVWHAVPVKDLLLLLRADAVVLVEEVKKGALWLLERSIIAGLEVAQVGEDAFLKLLGVLDWATKGLEAKGKAADNVGAGDVEEGIPALMVSGVIVDNDQRQHIPQHARHIFARGKEEAADVLIIAPIDRRGDEKVLDCKGVSSVRQRRDKMGILN